MINFTLLIHISDLAESGLSEKEISDVRELIAIRKNLMEIVSYLQDIEI